jgi:signal transduction histidine kinase
MLRRLVERANSIGAARVALTAQNIDMPFDGKMTFHIFRMVQEALNNALRHSQAENIVIDCKREDNKLLLCISDDGVGFNAASVHEGLGLALITERAKSLKGVVTFDSSENHGTKVRIELPIP